MLGHNTIVRRKFCGDAFFSNIFFNSEKLDLNILLISNELLKMDQKFLSIDFDFWSELSGSVMADRKLVQRI